MFMAVLFPVSVDKNKTFIPLYSLAGTVALGPVGPTLWSRNIWTNTGRIVIKFSTDVHGHPGINHDDLMIP